MTMKKIIIGMYLILLLSLSVFSVIADGGEDPSTQNPTEDYPDEGGEGCIPDPTVGGMTLYVGATTQYMCKIITLERVSEFSGVFSVDDITKVIDDGDTEEVNGIFITASIHDTYAFVTLRGEPIPEPDYRISAIRISPALVEGQKSTLYVTVQNDGDSAIGYSWLNIYLNGNQISHVYRVPGLGHGETYMYEQEILFFNDNSQVIRAVADAENGINEADETNNEKTETFTVESTKSDLSVQEIKLALPNPIEGRQGVITAKITNLENSPTGQYEADLYIDGVFKVRKTMSSLSSGASATFTHYFTYQQGIHTAKIVVDPSNQISETIEANNQKSFIFTVASEGNPDLMVTQIKTVPAQPVPGQMTTIMATIKNTGTTTTSGFYSSFDISGNSAGNRYVSSLLPGTTVTVALGYYFPAGLSTITVKADVYNAIAESNEGNNLRTWMVSGQNQQPDFIVDSIKISPSTPTENDQISISFTFKNQGTQAGTLWYTTTLRDPVKVAASGTSASEDTQQSRYLQPGQSYTTIVYSRLSVAGTYTATATADPNNKVVESNEGNNYKSHSFYVRAQATPTEVTTYLDQKFELKVDQTARIADYKNLEITMISVGPEDDWATFEIKNIPTSGPIILHRDHLYCKDDAPVVSAPNAGVNQVIEVGPGTNYWNYKCINRYQEQCNDDGTFDTYYKEWCEYPESTPSTLRKVTLKPGQVNDFGDVELNLIDITSGKAILMLSKEEQTPTVNIAIEPRTASVTDGNKAYYSLVVEDGHSDNAIHIYDLAMLRLPYEHTLPDKVRVMAGSTQKISFYVDTSKRITVSPVEVSVDYDDVLEFEEEAQAVEYCLNNADDDSDYVSCMRQVDLDEPVEVSEYIPYNGVYRFAVRAYTQDTVSDVAYGTLYVRSITVEPPEFPSEDITIDLHKGWNLVSLGGSKLGSFSDTTCNQEQKLLSFAWMSDLEKYVSIVKAQSILGNSFNDFISKNAFWVYSFEDCQIKGEVDKYIKYNDLGLESGWNLVPVTEGMVGQSLSGMGNNCNFQKIYGWDAQDQSWEAISEDDIFQEEDVFGGMVVKTSGYCQLGKTLVYNPPEFPE